MKSGNKIIITQEEWRLERLLQWPVSASYHHQGWCTSTDKDLFESYSDRGQLYVIFRPKDRRNRPSLQLFITKNNYEIKGSGNSTVDVSDIIKHAPARVATWVNGQVQAIDEARAANLRARMERRSSVVQSFAGRMQPSFRARTPPDAVHWFTDARVTEMSYNAHGSTVHFELFYSECRAIARQAFNDCSTVGIKWLFDDHEYVAVGMLSRMDTKVNMHEIILSLTLEVDGPLTCTSQ